MSRAIVRVSLDNAGGTDAMIVTRKILQDGGFVKVGTASYEYDDPSDDLGPVFEVLDRLTDHLRHLPGGVSLDHLWVYVDLPDEQTLRFRLPEPN